RSVAQDGLSTSDDSASLKSCFARDYGALEGKTSQCVFSAYSATPGLKIFLGVKGRSCAVKTQTPRVAKPRRRMRQPCARSGRSLLAFHKIQSRDGSSPALPSAVRSSLHPLQAWQRPRAGLYRSPCRETHRAQISLPRTAQRGLHRWSKNKKR